MCVCVGLCVIKAQQGAVLSITWHYLVRCIDSVSVTVFLNLYMLHYSQVLEGWAGKREWTCWCFASFSLQTTNTLLLSRRGSHGPSLAPEGDTYGKDGWSKARYMATVPSQHCIQNFVQEDWVMLSLAQVAFCVLPMPIFLLQNIISLTENIHK